MKVQSSLMLFSGLLFFAVSGACGAEASVPSIPTPAEAEAGMKSDFRKDPEQKNVDSLKVHKVHGCVPAFDRPATDFVCVLDWHRPSQEGEEGDLQEKPVPFRHKGGTWSFIDEFLFPACPSLEEAQRLLRAFKKNDRLKVTSDIDDGEGIFTDKRGIVGQKKGPLRIMCRYEVESRIGDRMAISYFWYENGKYRLDEVDDWID